MDNGNKSIYDSMVFDEQIHAEFVDENTGQFVTICKIKMKHLAEVSEYKNTMRQMAGIYSQIVLIDGERLTESQWLEKDMSECQKIIDKVNEQVG